MQGKAGSRGIGDVPMKPWSTHISTGAVERGQRGTAEEPVDFCTVCFNYTAGETMAKGSSPQRPI